GSLPASRLDRALLRGTRRRHAHLHQDLGGARRGRGARARHRQDGIDAGILRAHPSAIAHRPRRQHREGGSRGDRERSGTEELAFDPYRPVAPPAFEDLRGIEDAYGIEDLLEIHREEEDRIRGEAMTEVPATFFARAGL